MRTAIEPEAFQAAMVYRTWFGRADDTFRRIKGLFCDRREADARLAEARRELLAEVSGDEAVAAIEDAYAARRPRY